MSEDFIHIGCSQRIVRVKVSTKSIGDLDVIKEESKIKLNNKLWLNPAELRINYRTINNPIVQ